MQHLYSLAKPFFGLACLVLFLSTGAAVAQTTTFSYQGRLSDSGTPANGIFDLQFTLYDTADVGTGALQGSPNTVTNPSVQVTDGVFTVQLDFGASAFSGGDRFLEINVRHAGDPSYTTLATRQQLTSPYSLRTLSAATADSLSPGCNGCVLDAHIQSVAGDKVSGTVASANSAGRAATAGNVTGVVQIANGGTGSSTQNFVDLSTSQAKIGGDKEFTGAVSVTGGSGVFKGNGAGLSNLNGSSLADASIPQAKLAYGATSRYDLQLLAMLRWDLLPTAKTIDAGYGPSAFAFDSTFIYVANTSGKTVTRIRAGTGAVEGNPIAVGSFPIALAFDGTFIYVANGNSSNVTRIRASTGVVDGSPIGVGTSPCALAFDGTFMYVANYNSNNVMRIRASTGAVEGKTIAVGDNPRALAFDGTFIYVANYGSNNVTRIRASTGAVEGSPIIVADGPSALAFDGTFIYAANYGSHSVTRF